MQLTTIIALLASSVAVNAMPGGGWGWTSSSCITKSTCSKATVPYTSIFTTPETSVSTCVTSYPFTHTGLASSVYTTTEASSQVGSSTKTVWSTVTKSNVWSTYTEICTTQPVVKTSTWIESSSVVTPVPVTSTVYVTETKTTQVSTTSTGYSATTEYKTITTEKPCTTTGWSTESKCESTTSWSTWGGW